LKVIVLITVAAMSHLERKINKMGEIDPTKLAQRFSGEEYKKLEKNRLMLTAIKQPKFYLFKIGIKH
jgi:hypothetical protein